MFSFFFFNDTATTEIYTLSLHDALPILFEPSMRMQSAFCRSWRLLVAPPLPYVMPRPGTVELCHIRAWLDRKSTRLNSSHANISYAVFCLKKKNYKCRYYVHIPSLPILI